MMTQQLGFSILTAPLAAIDRRALSQAWYSALHLASAHGQPAAAQIRADRAVNGDPTMHRGQSRERVSASRKASSAPSPARHASKATPDAVPERRAARSVLARRIERTFLDPVARTQRATFTIDGAHARVHVALQTTAAGVRIVAVCPASIAARVSRALDEARYALAARGIAVQSDVSGT